MRVLLLSMPDSFEHTPMLAMRMPNGALASLAGNVDPHHQVAIADLVLVQQAVVRTVERLMHEIRSGSRRAVGDDIPAADRARAHPLDPAASSPMCRSLPAATTRAWRPTPTKRRPPVSTSWFAGKGI